MESNNLKLLSMEEYTYWPSDRNKLLDLVGFCVTKSIPQDCAVAKSCFELPSDHSPILVMLTVEVLNQERGRILSNRHINWDDYRCLINERLTLNIPLKPRKALKQQPNSSMIQFNVQVGMQCRNIKGHSRRTTVL
jgi:hypothetical protein